MKEQIVVNPLFKQNYQKAIDWLNSNLDRDMWREEGKAANFVFSDAEDEFKFKLAIGNIPFVTTKSDTL